MEACTKKITNVSAKIGIHAKRKYWILRFKKYFGDIFNRLQSEI